MLITLFLTQGQDAHGFITDIDQIDPGAPYIVDFEMNGARTQFSFSANSMRLDAE